MSNPVSHEARIPKIGDIYLVQFSGTGSEQRGIRPGVVFQNNIGNVHSPNVIMLPLTSCLKKLSQPTHVFLPASETGLVKDSMVLCENPEIISKVKLTTYLTTLPEKYMIKVAEANLIATSAIAFIDYNRLLELKDLASRMNEIQNAG